MTRLLIAAAAMLMLSSVGPLAANADAPKEPHARLISTAQS